MPLNFKKTGIDIKPSTYEHIKTLQKQINQTSNRHITLNDIMNVGLKEFFKDTDNNNYSVQKELIKEYLL